MIHYIYRITHLPTGRFYIGKRSYKGTDYLDDTYMGSGVIIRRMLKKHPRFEFRKEVLCFCRDAEQLLKAEQAAVSVNFPTNPLCINLCAGGRGTVGFLHSAEARARIAEANAGKILSTETRQKVSRAQTGKPKSAAHRAKMIEVNRGNKYRLGSVHTPEALARMSASKIKDTVNLLSATGTIYEVNTADIATELAAGGEFASATVRFYNEALGVCVNLTKSTAKSLILLNAGWQVGKRTALRQISIKEIDKATGLLKAN